MIKFATEIKRDACYRHIYDVSDDGKRFDMHSQLVITKEEFLRCYEEFVLKDNKDESRD